MNLAARKTDLLLAIAILASACSSTQVETSQQAANNVDLAAAIRIWTDAGISDYRYTTQVGGTDCKLTVTVRKGSVSKTVCENGEHLCSPTPGNFWGMTINELLVAIAGWKYQDIHQVRTIEYYHAEFGFPVNFAFDIPRSSDTFGGQFHLLAFSITKFEIL